MKFYSAGPPQKSHNHPMTITPMVRTVAADSSSFLSIRKANLIPGDGDYTALVV